MIQSCTKKKIQIDVRGLNIGFNGRDLLVDAHLKLQEGRHYILVGRNGVGKSTLLRSLHEHRIPGISSKLRVLLLGQTEQALGLEDDLQNLRLSNQEVTTLQHVVRSDRSRERSLREVDILTQAIENSSDATAPVRAYRQLNHERLERSLKEAQLIATRRSGARGWDARKVLNEMEAKVEASSVSIAQLASDIDAETIETETQAAIEMLDVLQSLLQDNGSSTAEKRARAILMGLRFSEEKLDQPFNSLSGGWRTRCDLACTLFMEADLLMLDEPTNYLDLPAVIWLQSYIESLSSSTVIIVTHDRDFADAVTEELIVFREQKLEFFDGNLSAYETERWQQIKRMTKMKEASDRKSAHMSKTIEHNVQAAKRTGDDKKLKQAASRRKKLEERTGLEVGISGGRFKLNRDLTGFHNSVRDAIEIPTMDPAVRMSFPSDIADLRFPGALLSFEGVSFKYPAMKDVVLKDIDLTIHPGDRIGLAGLNGCGKSTLIQLAVGSNGHDGGLKPATGSITKHPRAQIGWFSQHAVEELEAIGHAGEAVTALTHLIETARNPLTEQDGRALLSSIGLHGKTVSDIPLPLLSGGQRVRLAIAKLLLPPPHLLILDEVTTHLDADTVVALIGALKAYKGAVLVVTHDRFFMRCVVQGERLYGDDDDDDDGEESEEEGGGKVGKVYRLSKARLALLEGGMEQYAEIAERASRRLGK